MPELKISLKKKEDFKQKKIHLLHIKLIMNYGNKNWLKVKGILWKKLINLTERNMHINKVKDFPPFTEIDTDDVIHSHTYISVSSHKITAKSNI